MIRPGACLSYANQPIQSLTPHHLLSHFQGHHLPVQITCAHPELGNRQLEIAPAPQRLLKLLRPVSPKPAYTAMSVPSPGNHTVGPFAHILLRLLLPAVCPWRLPVCPGGPGVACPVHLGTVTNYLFFFTFLKCVSWERESLSERGKGRERERERERILSKLHLQPRAGCGARSHEPGAHDLS